ncbi:SusF/SusE family outer membrane protein [Leptobacterium flavescens]|uniref:SusF/SusE family outer membrane protein n=1 Tax=Leptobacterium flavescens TaxID=472055 RepID=A0A6P0UNU8_9FLAO|nr:SusE domain-containing protein [Leptobacterium flavescens]NER14647.1 SusF/SusE family outer membrane protein [Leptobacterium flavescens]
MKKILATLVILAALTTNWSCSDDDREPVAALQELPELLVDFGANTYVLTEQTVNNLAVSLIWSAADFGFPAQVNYTVQGDMADGDFSEPISFGTTTETFFNITVGQLNDAALGMGLTPFEEGQMAIRVVGVISDNVAPAPTETVVLNVTPFTFATEPEPARLAVPGDHQGWNPDPNAVEFVPFLQASSATTTDFEGFVELNNEFKFVGANDDGNFVWGNIDWGDASGTNGSYTQVLTDDGEGNCGTGTVGGPGYYLVRANTEDLTYSLEKTEWGIIGNATPTGWDSDTDMTYDPVARVWTITIDLVQQDAPDNGLKFRANDDWAINIGDTGADGIMEFGGDNIGVPEDGNYTVVLDLSNPRQYTYTLTKN